MLENMPKQQAHLLHVQLAELQSLPAGNVTAIHNCVVMCVLSGRSVHVRSGDVLLPADKTKLINDISSTLASIKTDSTAKDGKK